MLNQLKLQNTMNEILEAVIAHPWGALYLAVLINIALGGIKATYSHFTNKD